MEKQLTLKQALCGARIFLNIFGLILEDVEKVDINSRVSILNQNHREVGSVRFEDNQVLINTMLDFHFLKASYPIPVVRSTIDYEENNALTANWDNRIQFSVPVGTIELSGEILLNCGIDSYFGPSCYCRPLLKCQVNDQDSIVVKMLRNSKMLDITMKFGKYTETIEFMPFDNLNGFIRHEKKKGDYNPQLYTYEYRKYAGIFSDLNSKDNLHVFLEERENDKTIDFQSEFPLKAGDDKSKELLIQKGKLMKELDEGMYQTLNDVKRYFRAGSTFLIDNLISIVFSSYDDETIKTLFGTKRREIDYQNHADNLVDAYYKGAIFFFDNEEPKQLMKK